MIVHMAKIIQICILDPKEQLFALSDDGRIFERYQGKWKEIPGPDLGAATTEPVKIASKAAPQTSEWYPAV
jgi:hypothetical protein